MARLGRRFLRAGRRGEALAAVHPGPALRARAALQTLDRWVWSALAAAGTWLVVNFPVWYWYHDSWLQFFRLNHDRPIDWGTFWYIGRYLDGK